MSDFFHTPINHEERNKFVSDTRILLARLPDLHGDMARLAYRLSIALEVIETIKKDPLSETEENVVKDILKRIGRGKNLSHEMAISCNMTGNQFETVTDSVFKKLGNGRVTLVTDEDEARWTREESEAENRALAREERQQMAAMERSVARSSGADQGD